MISELFPINPVARAVSSLLKSSFVWSTTSKGPSDDDIEGGGSELALHDNLRSIFAMPPPSGCSVRSGGASCALLGS